MRPWDSAEVLPPRGLARGQALGVRATLLQGLLVRAALVGLGLGAPTVMGAACPENREPHADRFDRSGLYREHKTSSLTGSFIRSTNIYQVVIRSACRD